MSLSGITRKAWAFIGQARWRAKVVSVDAGGVTITQSDRPGGQSSEVLEQCRLRREARARLIAKAPEAALLAALMARGVVRWERFPGSPEENRGELCFGGLRYGAHLDEFGVPQVSDLVWDRLRGFAGITG